MTSEPFVRYVIYRSVSHHWWERLAETFLAARGWEVVRAIDFVYEDSYGFDPEVTRIPTEVRTFDYLLSNATVVLEHQGYPAERSVFDPGSNRTLVDDILAFMSVYTGTYWQYLWREYRDQSDHWEAARAAQMNYNGNDANWAGKRDMVAALETALALVPTLDETQFNLAIRWFFSALQEFEMGRPLVEAALNWVALESQANYLALPGGKAEKVKALLDSQGFPPVPRLDDLYRLRNDAFHDGQLSNLSETAAQEARTAGRALVRAQILNLLGMPHAAFERSFVNQYAS